MVFNKKNNKDELDKKEVASRRKTILSDDTAFVAKESYKASRTNILFSMPDIEGCKVILFTSSVPGEGKTTTCVNTAISFAQIGYKVLLIEADLRRPRVCECFDKEIKEGFSNVLSGFAEIEDVIVNIPEYNLDVVAAGWIPPNPTELLASKKFVSVLEGLKEEYEYIFIDTPPVNTVTDAVLLTKYATGVIMVVRSKYTMKQNLSKAVNTLKFSNAKILGFIVNDSYISRNNTRYRGYKKYGNYYYGYYGKKRRGVSSYFPSKYGSYHDMPTPEPVKAEPEKKNSDNKAESKSEQRKAFKNKE